MSVEAILTAKPVPAGEDVIVLLNGLGGTPLVELYLLYGEVVRILAEAGLRVRRNLVGNYVTSLDMAGMSLTVCRADEAILRLWDAPVRTPALRWGC
jgi:phosphoenolpyruvate---glycerone phosphotransferase subunit DhaK